MARQLKLELTKTYATEANAVKAVEKVFPSTDDDRLTYIVMPTPEGRFYPIFIGERATQAQVHLHFHVVA